MDVEAGAEVTPAGDPGSAGSQNLWESVGQLAAALAAIASATYAVGFLALLVPIATTYAPTLTSAWYATLLIGRNAVVAHGVNQLLVPPVALWLIFESMLLLAAFAACCTGKVGRFLRSGPPDVGGPGPGLAGADRYGAAAIWILVLGVWFVLFFLPYATPGGIFELGEAPGRIVDRIGDLEPRWRGVGIGCLLVGFLVWMVGWDPTGDEPALRLSEFARAGRFLPAYRSLLFERYVGRPRQTLSAAMFYLAAFFFVALGVVVLFQNPPLPKAEVRVEGKAPVVRTLLVHADGYWHVFDKGKRGLVALPDERVREVRVPPRSVQDGAR